MRAKKPIIRIVGVIILALLFILIQYVGGNPYFLWYFDALYQVESAVIEQRMLPDGRVEVHETIEYLMRKPFRGVFREIPPDRYVTMDNVRLWTEGIEKRSVEFLQHTDSGFAARVWLVPQGSEERLNPREESRFTLHVTYTAKQVFENGQDVAQVFRQFWGGWDAPAGEVRGIFEFPPEVKITGVYTHPTLPVERLENRFLITAQNLPPETFAEVRFLADPLPAMRYAVDNPTLSLREIAQIEAGYRAHQREAWFPWTMALLAFIVLLILIFWFMGKEPEIPYQGIYERELPSDDPPDFVNAMVKNMAGPVDRDGLAATLMHLYQRDVIDFQDEEGKPTIRLTNPNETKGLAQSEIQLLELLKKFSSEGVFRFDDIEHKLRNSLSEARSFNSSLSAYESLVRASVTSRHYLQQTGNYLAKFLAVLMMLVSTVVVEMALQPTTGHLLPFLTVLAGAFWFGGGGILFVRRDFFGRWTREGRKYYLKWNNFSRYLTDYSLLSEHPPESVVLWEKYLVYATALGLASQVMRHLQQLIPREVWEAQSRHGHFYGAGFYLFGAQMYGLHSTAALTITQATSKSSGGFGGRGGFGGGGGGFGGGSGGGRGGAF
ncbi:MAG TPA: DUF2207 domain-containing protein [Atribacteraceae bacterium]|nr:DUF2207 domain-containing protein [Atribacteraceae bacterium]